MSPLHNLNDSYAYIHQIWYKQFNLMSIRRVKSAVKQLLVNYYKKTNVISYHDQQKRITANIIASVAKSRCLV